MPAMTFESIMGKSPYPMQARMWEKVMSEDCAVLLKSPTGSGKTEAVLIPSLVAGHRLFMIFPTRSLVEDQIGRVTDKLIQLSKGRKQYALVVDVGGQSQRRVFRDGTEITNQQFNSRRHLYDGDVIITTLDKFLYRFFGFGDERKGYIFPFRIFHGLKRTLFVFDEAHSYEDTAFTNFLRLIKALYVAHLDVVLMTATMPQSYAAEFDFLEVVDYLRSKKKPYPKNLLYLSSEKSQLIDQVVAEAQARINDKKSLIVTVETVEDAVAVWEKLGKPLLYHGRLDNDQRKKVYAELKQREKDGEGYILVTTSAIEVGCDLNADYLITEICNPASLIQRAGRCNRRGDRQDAEVIVIGNGIKEFLREISEVNEQAFIAKLQEKSGAEFLADDFLEFTQRGIAFDYRAEIMFDMLFEYVYDGNLQNKPLHDKGLVGTRSWEPSVTLTTDREHMSNAISVPISRCAAHQDKDWQRDIKVYVRYFNKHEYSNEYETVLKELEYGGFAYFKDIIIEVPQGSFAPETGYLEVPRPFRRKYPNGYKETVEYSYEKEGKNKSAYLNYLHWRPEPLEQQPTEAESSENDDADETK